MLLWEFPTTFLRAFKDVFILAYLFEGSVMASMLKAEKIEYHRRAVRNGRLVDWSKEQDAAVKADIRPLVHLYEGPANRLRESRGQEHRLSSSWLKRKAKANDPVVHQLRAATENFFKRHAATPSAQNGWTTFKHARGHLKGARYTRGFVPINAKATNERTVRSPTSPTSSTILTSRLTSRSRGSSSTRTRMRSRSWSSGSGGRRSGGGTPSKCSSRPKE